jgi:hypothetical protein
MRNLSLEEMALVAGGDDPTPVEGVTVTAHQGTTIYEGTLPRAQLVDSLATWYTTIGAEDEANNVESLTVDIFDTDNLSTLGVGITPGSAPWGTQSVISTINLNSDSFNEVVITAQNNGSGLTYIAWFDSDFNGSYDRKVTVGHSS